MPNTRQTHFISPSPSDPPSAGQSPRSEEGDFSEEGDAVMARFCDMIDQMPATSEDQHPADADEDEALSSISEKTVVAAALPADLGSHVQSRVREKEDEVLNYCTCPANKVPVNARKLLMARVFEKVAFLRAEVATERGAAFALQGRLVEARREVAALQRCVIIAEGRLDGWTRAGSRLCLSGGCFAPARFRRKPDGVGVPSSSARSVVDEARSASFHRAVECEKLITDILFDTNCKVTNSHRSQILGHLRQLVQECADVRAVAARQCGKADELRDQLTQARLAGSTVLQPATSSGPAELTYAAAARGGLRPVSAFPPGLGAAAAPAAMPRMLPVPSPLDPCKGKIIHTSCF
ncbi:hypothetical protein HPB49_026639 [Dermacentor silvarum]|nr:hypothetical protein HPB49_026639 [Dermacentor silvarum]